jgi:hypothetical protein
MEHVNLLFTACFLTLENSLNTQIKLYFLFSLSIYIYCYLFYFIKILSKKIKIFFFPFHSYKLFNFNRWDFVDKHISKQMRKRERKGEYFFFFLEAEKCF